VLFTIALREAVSLKIPTVLLLKNEKELYEMLWYTNMTMPITHTFSTGSILAMALNQC
jgi:hypothetical protein